MITQRFVVGFVVILLLMPTKQIIAFECRKAKSKTEKAICSSPDLIAMDGELNQVYKSAIQANSDPAKLKDVQKNWIKLTATQCESDVSCLKQRYSTRIAEIKSVLIQSPLPSTPVFDGITYRNIEKSLEKPIKLSLKHIEFLGTNQKVVAQFNQAIKDIWHDEKGCEVEGSTNGDLDSGEMSRELTVRFFNNKVAVLAESVEAFCPGNAHPENYVKTYVIDAETGKTIDFWEKISKLNKDKLIAQISKMGIEARGDEEECKSEYVKDSLRNNEIKFSIKNHQAVLTPSFRHATQACEEDLSLPMEEFKKYFKGDALALGLLDALK